MALGYGWSIIAMMAAPFVVLGILGTIVAKGGELRDVAGGDEYRRVVIFKFNRVRKH